MSNTKRSLPTDSPKENSHKHFAASVVLENLVPETNYEAYFSIWPKKFVTSNLLRKAVKASTKKRIFKYHYEPPLPRTIIWAVAIACIFVSIVTSLFIAGIVFKWRLKWRLRGVRRFHRNQILLGIKIDTGTQCDVYKGSVTDKNGKKTVVAVKRLHNKQHEAKFLTEAWILDQLKHANVCHLIGLCLESGEHLMVLEHLDQGDLIKFLSTNPMSTEEMIEISIQIGKVCKQILDDGFLHRDLKADNCLIRLRMQWPGRRRLEVVLADFGFAVDVGKAGRYKASPREDGPCLSHLAPECLITHEYSEASEVYSFVMTVWEILNAGRKPFADKVKDKDAFVQERKSNREMRPPVPDKCPVEVKYLFHQGLHFDPEERPTMKDVIKRLEFCRNEQIIRRLKFSQRDQQYEGALPLLERESVSALTPYSQSTPLISYLIHEGLEME